MFELSGNGARDLVGSGMGRIFCSCLCIVFFKCT